MKSKKHFLSIFFIVILIVVSCNRNETKEASSKNDASESIEYSDDLKDLKDFPHRWAMLSDLAPDTAMTRDYVLMKKKDGSYAGEILITYQAPTFIMTVTDILGADEYEILSCKKHVEGEMIYVQFALQTRTNKESISCEVNFREDPNNAPNGSPWSFSNGSSGVYASEANLSKYKTALHEEEFD